MRSPPAPCKRRLRSRSASTFIWWKRNKRAACSIVWSVTKSRRCSGIKCGAAFPPGRVQTVALRLIVEREREIRAFLKQEYWTIDVALNAKKAPVLTARLNKRANETATIPNEARSSGDCRRSRRCDVHRQISRHARKEAQSRGAVHHVHVAAGIVPQVPLQRQAHHDAGARSI